MDVGKAIRLHSVLDQGVEHLSHFPRPVLPPHKLQSEPGQLKSTNVIVTHLKLFPLWQTFLVEVLDAVMMIDTRRKEADNMVFNLFQVPNCGWNSAPAYCSVSSIQV